MDRPSRAKSLLCCSPGRWNPDLHSPIWPQDPPRIIDEPRNNIVKHVDPPAPKPQQQAEVHVPAEKMVVQPRSQSQGHVHGHGHTHTHAHAHGGHGHGHSHVQRQNQIQSHKEGSASGKQGMAAGSDTSFDFYCELCKEDGKNLEAEGYCVDCSEYLCGTCFMHHRRTRSSRHHELMSKSDMPKDKPLSTERVSKDISTKCHQHKGETVKYYCKFHDVIGCSSCFVTGHRTCGDIENVSEISESVFDSQEYREFIHRLKSFEQRSRNIIAQTRENVSKAETCCSLAIRAVKDFRKEINKILDDLERGVITQAEKIRAEDEEKMRSVSDRCNTSLETIEKIISEFVRLQASKRVCQAYINMKETKREVSVLHDQLQEIEEKSIVRAYEFKPNKRMKDALKCPDSLGRITIQGSLSVKAKPPVLKDPIATQAAHVADIDVRTKTDTAGYCITGVAVLSHNRLVVADDNNRKVKLLDTQANKLIAELKILGRPWDVAVMSRNQVAVTVINSRKILLLRVSDTLTVEKEITVDGECCGVAYSQGRLVVTFVGTPKLEIMGLDGGVLKRVENDNDGRKLFSRPDYVCVAKDDQSIYVSDGGSSGKVINLTFDGVVNTVYTDSDLKCPNKLSVDHRGNVFVCGSDSRNVHLITPDCRKVKVILTQSAGLTSNPYSVSYCQETNRIFIGMYDSKVKVYQLS